MTTVGDNRETVKPVMAGIVRQAGQGHSSVYVPLVTSWGTVEGAAGARPAPLGAGLDPVASPSLSVCHNCITEVKVQVKLPGSSRKMAEVIRLEVERLAREYGVEKLGFLTLSFPDAVFSISEAQRRYHSLLTNFLSKHFKGGIVVWERFDHGIHWHILVVAGEDIRTGFDFEAVKRRDYRSASHYLRAMWATLRVVLPEYEFGRHELLPVRTVAEAIGRYLGKYIAKHCECKLDIDRGARIVRFFGCAKSGRVASAQFAWANGRARIWRLGVGAFAEHFGVTWSDLSRIGGARWAFHLGKDIYHRGLMVWKGGDNHEQTETEGVEDIERIACPG